ncbi:MAG TPA: Rrf2 family transcriptional regulator [Polyangia bacterium]|jgi:Rrf2 family protein|nr:Rrf2 family transcriptional regulator [Polyangia bacterium]
MTSLSRKGRYALRALYALAAQAASGGGPMLIADLAERERIPRKFLEAILLELKNSGVLHSKKGKGGGYVLAKDPSQIVLGEVIRTIDGPLAPIPCVSERAYARCDECVDEATCGTRLVMKQVRDAIAQILDHTTLASAMEQSARARRKSLDQVAYAI